MENFEGLSFRKFEAKDIECFTPIMKRTFDKDSQIHLGTDGGPDGYDNGGFLKKCYLNKNASAYAVYKENKPIGAINVWIKKDHINFLGDVFIDPDFQDKGIGLVIWKFIEQKFPETKTWMTETPGFSHRNHHFYVNKCGFKICRIENPKNKSESSFLMEKVMQ